MVFPLGEPEWLEDPLRELAHPEESRPNNADDVVVLGMEGDLGDWSPGGGQVPQGGDHLVLLPKEVYQAVVGGTALGQEVLGVVGEGEGDDLR